MMQEEKPKILKIIPYRGPNEEITEGKKTKISLYKDRLEYSIEYTQKVKLASSEEDMDIKDSIAYHKEEGFLLKEHIHGIVKYIKTEYTEEIDPYIVNFVDILSVSNSITFSMETEEAKNDLYKELYDWKIS